MVASNRHEIYTILDQSPMSSLREDRVHVPHLNALRFLQRGYKNNERGGGTYARRGVARREALGTLQLW
jgi:hypothetical protein